MPEGDKPIALLRLSSPLVLLLVMFDNVADVFVVVVVVVVVVDDVLFVVVVVLLHCGVCDIQAT